MAYCKPGWIAPYRYESLWMNNESSSSATATQATTAVPVDRLAVFGTIVTPTQAVTLSAFYHMERATDSKHFVDKPKGETTACVQCHSVATKCDSCHTRHRFDAAEARRAEACTTCHSGPPHPDDETYYGSAHGKRYLADAQKTDWSKPLKKGNYTVPTCAYCHMRNGQHVVADKSIWQFGLRQVNPNTAENKVKRDRWVEVCMDCHDEVFSRRQLTNLDHERAAG